MFLCSAASAAAQITTTDEMSLEEDQSAQAAEAAAAPAAAAAATPAAAEGGDESSDLLSDATLTKVLQMIDRARDLSKLKVGPTESLNDYTIFADVPMKIRSPMVEAASKNIVLDRAMGSVVGMGVGDGLGHPFEFQPAQSQVRPGRPHFDLQTFQFHGETNVFGLQRGQWTDDASMGLCMADSLIMRNGFDGSDMRTRFWCWWNRGYDNAFRKDRSRSTSVGLGGNISKSLNEVYECRKGVVPPEVRAGTEDAGNGSLMRFAPIAVFMHAADMQEVLDVSRKSSYTTHPGIIAAEACSFLGHLIVSALKLPAGQPTNVKAWLVAAADDYLKVSGLDGKSGWGFDQMTCLVRSTPINATEGMWNWRSDTIDIESTLKARGSSYNGYPVSAGYFGSYSMDGLALALWSVYNSTSFDEAVTRSVNLLGDADSHGSITGQLAGAIYGYTKIHPQFLQWLNKWDDDEFAIRAILLHHLGSKHASAKAKA